MSYKSATIPTGVLSMCRSLFSPALIISLMVISNGCVTIEPQQDPHSSPQAVFHFIPLPIHLDEANLDLSKDQFTVMFVGLCPETPDMLFVILNATAKSSVGVNKLGGMVYAVTGAGDDKKYFLPDWKNKIWHSSAEGIIDTLKVAASGDKRRAWNQCLESIKKKSANPLGADPGQK